MGNISQAIEEYFSDYSELRDDIETCMNPNPIRGIPHEWYVKIPALIQISLAMSIVHFGIYIPQGEGNEYAGMLFYWVIFAFISYGLLQKIEERERGPILERIYQSIHWILRFRPPRENLSLSDREVIHYWLYKLWSCPESELDDVTDNFLSFLDGDYLIGDIEVRNHEVQEFVTQLKNNPDYTKAIVEEDLETILRHIIEFETGTVILEGRGEFIENIFENEYLSQLSEELNKAYQYELDSTVFILGRKYTENVLSQFYLENFPERGAHYDSERGQFKSLGGLEKQVSNDVREFSEYTPLFNQEFVDTVGRIREKGNKHVHNADVIHKKQELSQLREDLEHLNNVVSRLESKLE